MTPTDIYHRNPNERPPLARAGREQFIIASEDVSQAPIMDLSCGAAVTGLGHSNLKVKDAMIDQLRNLAYCHSAQFTHPTIEAAGTAVMDALTVSHKSGATWAPFEGGAVTFFSGGAEAIEAAVKMAMQYQAYVSPGTAPAQIIGRRHSYHGNSMFTLALGDHPRKYALSTAFNVSAHVVRIEAFAPHLFGPAGLNHDDLRAHCAIALRSLEQALVLEQKRKRRCIVVIETVGGTTLAIAPPTIEYLMGVRKLCNDFDAVLIYDEILCANYRTGRLTAWQYYQEVAGLNLAPDIFVMGKGITAGYFPMSAVVVNKGIRDIGMAEGKVWHTSTNQNHVLGCAALCAAFEQYEAKSNRIRYLSHYMEHTIAPMLVQTPGVFNVSGVGLLWGVMFAGAKPGLHLTIKKELFKLGYSVYSDGGTVEGMGNMIMFAPPFTVTEYQLDGAVKAIMRATDSAYNLHS